MSRKFSFAHNTIVEAVQHAIGSLHVPSNSKYKGKLQGKTLRISRDSVARQYPTPRAHKKKATY